MKNQWRNAVRNLPERTPRAGTWENIAQTLEIDDAIQNTLTNLPTHEPKADTWRAVAKKLPPQAPRLLNLAWQRYATVAAAVSVVVASIYLLKRSDESPSLTYSEELVSVVEAPLGYTADHSEQELWTYIQQLCREPAPPTCQHPEFVALRSHLVELTEEEAALQEAIEQFGYDPQLVKYQVRIENMKADAAKELVQMAL